MKRSSWRNLVLLIALGATSLAPQIPTSIRAAEREGFESADVSWRLADYDGAAKLILHERDFTAARSGQGCEHIRLWAKQATYAHLAHPVEPAPVIDELIPSIWVKANRPGLQILARVVLPRSLDKTGKPLTVLLGGDFYDEGSVWQQLQVRNIAKLLRSEVILYNAKFQSVDDREAYLDHIVINGYGGSDITDIFIDDLEVAGFVATGSSATGSSATGRLRPATPSAIRSAVAGVAVQPGRIELRRSVIVADGRPLFVKVIEHNGESFRWLKSLGFNTVWLNASASRSQLAEAADAGVWLVCPPPSPLPAGGMTDAHRPVLAWHVQPGTAGENESRALEMISQVRRSDAARRPIVALNTNGRSPTTNLANILVAGRPILGTKFDIQDYNPWLRDATRSSRERPFWGSVPTEHSDSLQRQFTLAAIDSPDIPPALEQIRLAAFATVAAGARGICFRSATRLDSDRETSVLRAKMLQLVNAELSLVEPWAAGAESRGVPAAESDTRLTLLDAERSRMLIAIRHGTNEQYEPQARADRPLALAPHLARPTDNAYLLTPNGLQPLRASQAAASPITLHDPDRVSLILLTHDSLAISRVGRDLAAIRNDHARISYQLAKHRLDATAATLSQLGRADAQSESTLEQAEAVLEQADQSLRTGDYQRARQAVREADLHVQKLRRTTWELEIRNFTSPASSPLCASFDTLPLHRHAAEYFATGRWSENLLPASGFESLAEMLRSGWRQDRAANVREAAVVELTPQEPAAGRSALRLVMPVADRVANSDHVKPLSLKSPPIHVRAGQVIRIQGWIDVPGRIADKQHRLMIVDSLNGEDLAECIAPTRGWQEFTLYRLCPADGDLRLTFRMLRPGEARLDAVSVSVLQQPPGEPNRP